MSKTIWICPSNDEKIEELVRSKSWFHKEVIVIHSSNKTKDFPFQQNIRLEGDTLKEKVEELEEYIEQIGKNGESICIIAENSHIGLTDSALFFMMAHFPTQTKLETSFEKWVNIDVNWKYEEVFHVAHHLISQNKFSSAEILLNTYIKNKEVFHLLNFGKNLLNGNSIYSNENNKGFYFDLLINVLRQLIQENEEEIHYAHDMRKLQDGDQKAFIYFLQNYSNHLYENGDLVNFIVLFYRLAEELLLYAMGWDVNENNQYFIRDNAKEKIPFDKPFSRHFSSYLKLVEQQLKRYPGNDYIKNVYEDFSQEWLLNFLDLRHAGVSGHGFMHYNIQMFQEICGGKPLDKINMLLEKYNVKATYDLFEIVQKSSLALIRDTLIQ